MARLIESQEELQETDSAWSFYSRFTTPEARSKL